MTQTVHELGGDLDRLAWGVVSDRDLVAVAAAGGLDERTAGATAATSPLAVGPAETLERAAQLLAEHGVGHLVVVDPRTVRPIGVLSTLDVARAAAGLDQDERASAYARRVGGTREKRVV